MGLMLSVLVCCVGVIELITFYHNITRHFTDPPQRGDLSSISDRYIHELGGIRKRIAEDLQKYQEQSPPTLRLNSHEDIEIEYSEQLQRSRSPSPRRFLVTEKEDSQRESNSPRKFLISEEPNGLKRSKSQDSIPEFLIHEEQNTEKSPHKPRYILKEKQTEESPLPLPRQFIVSEETLNTVVFEDTDFEVPASSVSHEKSPSPFLTVEPPQVPRNSICNELEREEEEALKAIPPHASQKVDVILENTSHNTTQYWTNKVLVVPSGTSRSRSSSPDRSTSSDTRENVDHSTKYDEKYLNNLDGVSKAKSIKRFGSSRKSVKRKTVDHNQNCLDQNSLDSLDTTAVLTHAAEELKKVSSEEEEIGSSKTPDSKNPQPKPGEPFWLIFSGEYTKAMNKDWHGQHFCCWQCDESLTGQRYVLRDEHPYCVSCYESVFANACEKCSKVIGIDSKDLSYKDKHWHEACFLCTTCGESLVDKQFGSKGDRIYCGNCYDQQFASRCDGCHEIFRADVMSEQFKRMNLQTKTVGEDRIRRAKERNEDVAILSMQIPGEKTGFKCCLGVACLQGDPTSLPLGTKKMEYKTRQWHEKCFCCCVCKVPIGTQSFIPREQEIYCAKCYEEKFATRCIKCNKVITSGGVTYKNEPWHRECFTCTNCQRSLAGERFTSRDDKPYCAECFGELFAKRCTACRKPITGIGGTKFISFEERHWHNDCFFCASCKTSLVGRGFITDQDDIICPDCAKTKLM